MSLSFILKSGCMVDTIFSRAGAYPNLKCCVVISVKACVEVSVVCEMHGVFIL